jgi:hypothetical protein
MYYVALKISKQNQLKKENKDLHQLTTDFQLMKQIRFWEKKQYLKSLGINLNKNGMV